MKFIYNDGGRAKAGYKGETRDCVVRAVSIATGLPYKEVYDTLSNGCRTERGSSKKPSARNGVNTKRKWFIDYMKNLGWKWTPTMNIGSGCKVHLKSNELPMGKLIVSVSRHYCAVIDGVLHDIENCSRHGSRCVYGYWSKD